MSHPNEPGARAFWARHAVGDAVSGTVVSLAPFGAFVELADDVHGLVHESEWHDQPPRPGDRVRAEILAMDADSRRLSLRPA
jgi:small subunit ribosomal protein S1